jgi:ectoine hydroxylase-related dioxygenase (phytanoyl-CoA dioxygenase family)
MSVTEQVGINVRDVTDEEIAHFQEKGWVMLRSLISEEDAADLLQRAKQRMGDTAQGDVDLEHTLGRQSQQFRTYYKIDLEDPKFRALRTHRDMGHNAARLYGREMAIRSNTTLIAPKLPSSLAGEISGTGDTMYHQDHNVMGQTNSIAFWLALDEATPEMGTMRFRDGAHRLGWLTPPVLDWPQAQALRLAPPLTYRPGDATAHHQLMIHGAPENLSDRVRWAFIFSYFPAHTPFLGTPSAHTDGLGLEIGKPFDHPNFPLVYDPDAEL